MGTSEKERCGLPLFLFVAGDNPSSLTAYGNIRLALGMFRPDEFELEVINVSEFPDRAFDNRVLITPTLLAPSCSRRLIGDLSELTHVHYFLEGLPRQ